MRSVYNLLFLIFFALSSPYYFFRMQRRGDWRKGFGQRFALYDNNLKQAITNRQVMWLHAVSVGEMNVCVALIRALEPRLPNVKFLVSTTTTTGMAELKRKLPPHIGKIYYPVDRRKYVARALAIIHPSAIVLVEAEVWPNFLWRARTIGTPVFLVNGRLSDRSYPRYRKFGFLFRDLFRSLTAVGAQSADYAEKFKHVGCRTEAVQVTGNLKFDAARGEAKLNVPALFTQLGWPADTLVLVAGSTHDGEEDLLAEMLPRLRQAAPQVRLVLVPRHFERAREVARQLEKRAMKFVLRSEVMPGARYAPESVECLLVDSTGELASFYPHASVVFVGKSLTAQGGQNPIEPAAVGKPVVFGQNMQNFADVVKLFLAKQAVLQVRDAADLEQTLKQLFSDPARRAALGSAALKVVEENQGAIHRTVDMILEHLAGGDLYIVPPKADRGG